MTFDPFLTPTATHSVATAPGRAQVVVAGTVDGVDKVDWAGGPVLEATLVGDASSNGATLTLVFFGGAPVSVEPGCRLLAAGTVGTHRGRRVILNPQLWVEPVGAPALATAAS
jgi:hypothetical protein